MILFALAAPSPASAQSSAPSRQGTADSRPSPAKKARAKAMAQALVYSFILFLTVLIFAWALARFTRRFRAYVGGSPAKPTSSEDVWSMHRPPPEDGEESPSRPD